MVNAAIHRYGPTTNRSIPTIALVEPYLVHYNTTAVARSHAMAVLPNSGLCLITLCLVRLRRRCEPTWPGSPATLSGSAPMVELYDTAARCDREGSPSDQSRALSSLRSSTGSAWIGRRSMPNQCDNWFSSSPIFDGVGFVRYGSIL